MAERVRRRESIQSEKREQIRQQVEEGFESLVAELREGKSERFLQYLGFCARFHRYSAYNQMLIYLNRPDATFVAGYRKWQRLGYQVKRGESGIAILAPVTYKQKKDKEADKEQEEAEERLVGFRVRYVFDASQLDLSDGRSLPVFWQELPDDQEEIFQLVRQAVEISGIQVEEGRLKGTTQGVSQGGKIVLAAGKDSRSRTMTLVHEWAHEIMHLRGREAEWEQEVPLQVREGQAEAVSFIVSRYLDIENPFARDYLLSYGNSAETLIASLDQVQKASLWMIERLQPENVAQYRQFTGI